LTTVSARSANVARYTKVQGQKPSTTVTRQENTSTVLVRV
jgi:hypothetical protein